MLERYHYIAVCGPIGVGKTTLARRLANAAQAAMLLENAEANPFLERFYRDSARYALPTQLSFLLQRIEQLRELSHGALFEKQVVADFLIEQDPIFANLTLGADELALYQRIYDSLAPQSPIPDLVILLEARPETLISRLSTRGRAIDTAVSAPYLRELCAAYTRFFYQYNAAPLLIVNTEHLNPVDSDADFQLLLERITHMRGRREVFNRVT
jgi:deoxyguanosine kinase